MNKEESKKVRLCYSKSKQIPEFTDPLGELVKKLNLESGDDHVILLTKHNAEAIEKEIEQDDQYFLFSKILFEHFGKEKILTNEDRALFAFLRAIDIENSTGIWRYNKDHKPFYEMIDWMSDPSGDFFTRLEKGDVGLPDSIVGKWETRFRSFSSKACKYLSQFLYGADSYYINDSYVRRALLFYLDHYKVEHKNESGKEFKTSYQLDDYKYTQYEDLHYLLDQLREAAYKERGEELTRHEVDHILWYCYKSYTL